MTNKDLQGELKEKVKPGIKPSDLRSKPSSLNKGDDLKKSSKKPCPNPKLSPPIEINDEGYSSEEEKIVPIVPTKQVKDLQTKISALERQLQTYKDFKEADLKIKEKLKKQLEEAVKNEKYHQELEKYYQQQKKDLRAEINEKEDFIRELQEKNKRLIKTIEGLKKETNNKENFKQNSNKTFFCDNCQLTKQGEYIKRKVDSPFEPRMHGRICYLCSSCSPYVKEMNEVNLEEDNPYKVD